MQLPHKSGSQIMLRRVLCQCRAQARVSELQGRVGRIQVPPVLPIKIGAGHEAVIPLLVETHHNLQRVTVMVKPMLQKEGVAVGYRTR